MQTVFVLLVIGLFTHFIFLSRRGAYHFAQVFFFFFFSLLVVRDKLANWENVVAVQSWIYGSHSFGIGHITDWPVGDLVRQVAPPSQQDNLDVIMSG